jgi:hypothetical protein
MKKIAILFALFMFLNNAAHGQAASATWAYTADASAAVSGNVTATSGTYTGATATGTAYNASGRGLYNFPTADARSTSKYYEQTVTPAAGYSFTVSDISLYLKEASACFSHASVYYSLDGFSTSTQIGSEISVSTTSTQTSTGSLSIVVADGSTLTLRIYGYYVCDVTSTYAHRLKSVVISGTTAVSCTTPTNQATVLTTSSVASTSMTVGWTRGNGTAGVVVVARAAGAVDTDLTSGTNYTASATFGSGTQVGTGNYVIYKGTGTSVALTGLSASTAYYFAVYEYNTTSTCFNLTELTGNATTTVTANSIPFSDGFETGQTNGADLVSGTYSSSLESTSGYYNWFANSSLTSYNRTPRTGSFNACLEYSNAEWLFYPVNLTSGVTYDFSMYARQDGATSADASITVKYGTVNTNAGMTSTIIASTGIINGNYQNLTGSFTPGSTGVFYVGIKGDININPWYISIDDISIVAACTTPVTQATVLTSASITNTTMTVGWTRGSGTGGVVVVARSSGAVDSDVTNGTNYTASATFGSGTEVGTGNYVIYKGTGTSVALTGLNLGTTYYFAVYEYNTTSTCFNYTELTGNATTTGTAATTITWDGGGGDFVWTTAANWDGNIAPITNNDVIFATASTMTITGVPTLTLKSLTISAGTVTLSGATTTLTLGGNAGNDLTVASSKGLVLNDASITLASNATADISGSLRINTGTYNTNGTSVVTTVATTGSILNYSTVTCTSTSKLIFEGSSSYTHARNGGTIPTADWNGAINTATSTCAITGMTSSKPNGVTTASNTFYHFTWNCPSQSATLDSWDEGSFLASGESFSCLGNFTVSETNDQTIVVSDVSAGALCTFSIGGNLVLDGTINDYFILNRWTTALTFTVTGNVVVSGGHFDGTYDTGTTIINIGGNLTVSSGDFHVDLSSTTCNTTMNLTGNLVVSGGEFVGAYDSGSPTINIANITVSSGDILLARGTGAPTLNVSGNLNVSGTGRWYGQDLTSGAPTVNITGNLNVSDGEFYGVNFGSASPVYNVTGNVAISGSGDFYGSGYTAGSGDPTYNITGALTVSGGSTKFYGSGVSGGNPTFNIQGAVDLSTGTVRAASGYTSTTAVCTFNLTGASSNNLTLKTGLAYNSSAAWSWNISSGRTITLLSNVEVGGTASSCVFTNNGTLIMGTYTFPEITTAVASFVNASGATLKTAHLSGLSTTAATGAVQVTGTKTFSSAASYVFNGAAAQVTGNFGASTTPTASTVANLEFNNSSGVTLTAGLTVANAGTLTLTAGYHDIGTFTLQLGTSASNSLSYSTGGIYSSTDNGSFRRWIPTGAVTSTSGNYYGLFPFKKSATNLNVFEINSTSNITTAGFINLVPKFTSVSLDIVDYADDNATVQRIDPGKIVTVTFPGALAGGSFTVKMSGGNYAMGGTLSHYTLVTYTGAVRSYVGTWNTATGTTFYPVVTRTGVTTANLANAFVMGSYNGAATVLPIELLAFYGNKSGRNNDLKWITSSEVNNDFFSLEKTTDGSQYKLVGIVSGAGTSTQQIDYNLIDYDVQPIINYYRLVQTDFDGKSTISNVISIDNREGIDSEKEVVMITNILGQEVNGFYKGLVVILYSDGSSVKVIQ